MGLKLMEEYQKKIKKIQNGSMTGIERLKFNRILIVEGQYLLLHTSKADHSSEVLCLS